MRQKSASPRPGSYRPARGAAQASPQRQERALDAPLVAWVEAYLAALARERRASPHTLTNYRRDLGQLLAFLDREGVASAVALDRAALRSWLAQLSVRCAPASIARKLSSVRGLLRYVAAAHPGYASPAEQLDTPKVRRPLPLVWSREHAAEVMSSPGRDSRQQLALARRNAVILEFLYGCGVRVSELSAIDLGDLLDAPRRLRVLGKGRKEREVPVGRAASAALQEYLALRPELCHPQSKAQDPDALLLGVRGGRLGVRQIQNWVKHSGLLATGRADLHPHALRHMCASHMLEGGANLRVIQEILGHTSLSTTQQYTHLSVEGLLQTYDRSHPLARDTEPAKPRS